MIKLLIADDEDEVLKGLKRIIDWRAMGYSICGEAVNGTDTLKKIQILKPDVVLLDIRMPGYTGLEIIEQARSWNYQGKFIILSGYSDFSYAQSAVKLGVTSYLLKPVDEEELMNAVTEAKKGIENEYQKEKMLEQYRDTAKKSIVMNLIKGEADATYYDLDDLDLLADQYMVVLYEQYNYFSAQKYWNFSELLKASLPNRTCFEHFSVDSQEIILLKGTRAILNFYHILDYYQSGTQSGSPLDSIFLIYGRPVSYISELKESYQEVLQLLKRRFFCNEKQHVLSYMDLPNSNKLSDWQEGGIEEYPRVFSEYIQSGNLSMLKESLSSFQEVLYYSNLPISDLKRKLIDIFLQVKQIICHAYYNADIPDLSNDFVIETIMKKNYLYEIIRFYSEKFEGYMFAIGRKTGEDVMEDVLYYIDHNYDKNLRLETISALFGYNSSYMGKLFTRKCGVSFNVYLDQIRIENAKLLLANRRLKVYEVSEKVGYKNADYFYKKFRKYTNLTPAEYRNTL